MATSSGQGRFPNQMARITRDALTDPGSPAVGLAVDYFFGATPVASSIFLNPMSRIQGPI